MKRIKTIVISLLLVLTGTSGFCQSFSRSGRPDEVSHAEKKAEKKKAFLHPGLLQNRQSLDFMKSKVSAGEEPWKTAFENLKQATPLNFMPEPKTHISVGAYGANSSGGREFSQSATMAYNHALMWYITGKKAHADKAIEILNAWSPVLWDFDDNNAKLNVGLSGPFYLNAAEILKHTDAGWKEKDVERFTKLVLTVFYPTVKDFFTEANGNWDASIIYTLLCIGVFTDNPQIFDRAIERYHRGPGNSGITKYIYPNGQIQETTRDWDHVQLGLGEFAKAAQVAWTQGVDLYRVANNRLALGFEYAAKFMTGGGVPVYGVLSTRAKEKFRDIYEAVYDHYRSLKGIEMPFTAKAVQQTRPASFGLLTAIGAVPGPRTPARPLHLPDTVASILSVVGAQPASTITPPRGAVVVQPGDSIQAALDATAGKGGWVILAKGIHVLNAPLRMRSNVTLAGQGNASVLFLAPKITGKTIVNADNDMHDVAIRDLLIEGATSTVANTDPNADRRNRAYMNAASREGISFSADHEGQMQNIRLENLTVQNFTRSGVAVRGATNVTVTRCDFSDNGASVIPGAGFHHNLLLTRSSHCEVSNSRFDTSPWGNGVDVSFCKEIVVINNETARNKLSGIRCTESGGVKVSGNFTEGNDENGISFDALMDGSQKVKITNNYAGNNGKQGIYVGKPSEAMIDNNRTVDNGFDTGKEKK